MNLTQYDLAELKRSCDFVSNLVKEIQQTYNPDRVERKLFVSREDYKESLIKKNECPQDFYFFRFFDIFVQVVWHKKQKTYLIYIDGYYSHILDKFPRLSISEKSYIISPIFEETLQVFEELVIDIMQEKIVRNELF